MFIEVTHADYKTPVMINASSILRFEGNHYGGTTIDLTIGKSVMVTEDYQAVKGRLRAAGASLS